MENTLSLIKQTSLLLTYLLNLFFCLSVCLSFDISRGHRLFINNSAHYDSSAYSSYNKLNTKILARAISQNLFALNNKIIACHKIYFFKFCLPTYKHFKLYYYQKLCFNSNLCQHS